MVDFNEEKNEMGIKMNGCPEDLTDMQNALIDLMQNYNFKEYGEGANLPIYWGLEVLKATLPTHDQIKKIAGQIK